MPVRMETRFRRSSGRRGTKVSTIFSFPENRNEMRKKAGGTGVSPASVEDAVLFLKHYRYLDDEDYARRYVEKNDHKKSIRQMKFDLRQKGVSDDLVEMVFEDMEVDESAQILGLLRKKNYDPEEPDPAKRQKIYAFLARKGFPTTRSTVR